MHLTRRWLHRIAAVALAGGLAGCWLPPRGVPESCGDGVWSPLEQCDPGDPEYGAWCTETCELHACGDGLVGPGETCDPPGPDCGPTCQAPSCGDGAITPGEVCVDVQRLAIGAGLTDFAIGDLDADGDLDLVGVTPAAEVATLWLGDAGRFERSTTLDVGFAPHAVLYLDLKLLFAGEDQAVSAAYNGVFFTRQIPFDRGGWGVPRADGFRWFPEGGERGHLLTDQGSAGFSWNSQSERFDFQAVFAPFEPDLLAAAWHYVGPGGFFVAGYARSDEATFVEVSGRDETTLDTPAIPLHIVHSRLTIDEQPRLDWLGADGTLRLMHPDVGRNPSPDVTAAVPGATWARFTKVADEVVPVWIDADGVMMRVAGEDRRLLELSGLQGLELADLDEDGIDDVITADPVTGEVLVITLGW